MTQAKAKSNSVVTTVWTGDILTIEVLGAGSIMFDRTLASAANRDQAERHGWTQRHCDKAAKAAPQRTIGCTDEQWAAIKRAHTQGKYDSILASVTHYEAGNVAWKMSGQSEGGMLFEALCEMYAGRKSADTIRKFLDGRTDEQLKTVRKIPELVTIMNRLRMERSGSVDAGEALGDLDAMDGDGVTVDEEISQLMTDQ